MQHIINFTMGVRPVPTSNSGGKNKELEHGSRSGEFEDDLQDTDKTLTRYQQVCKKISKLHILIPMVQLSMSSLYTKI